MAGECVVRRRPGGWELHPVQAGRTPLGVLAEPLFAVSGTVRYYNILARSDFCTVEELAATPGGWPAPDEAGWPDDGYCDPADAARPGLGISDGDR